VAGGRRYETLTPNKVHKIRAHGGTILGTTSTGNFKVVTNKVGRRQVDREVMAKAKKTISALGLQALAVIGGSGSARTAKLLSEEGLPVISIPKTINNDLCSDSDYTFGFHSAVTVVTESIDRIRTTANAHQRMMVIEVMGDMSGWIALYGGIAASADVVLIPEIEYDLEKVISCIKARKATGQREIIVVVAEGSRLNGQLVTVHNKENGDERLGGIGNKLTQILQERTGIETRYCVLGHTQRGGTPCAFDRILGVRFGVEAVKLIEQKDFGKTVVLNGLNIDNVPIEEAVAHHRFVQPDAQIVSTARDLGIIFGDRAPEELHSDRIQASTKGTKPARKCSKSKSADSK
jgi:6-phosphofructokinase 1